MAPDSIVAKIEIVMFANGQRALKVAVPDRFLFNALMETAKQDGLAEFYKKEQQKVVAPTADAALKLKL